MGEIDLKYLCNLMLEDAIDNIKNRRLERTKTSGKYDVANWKDDWDWVIDDESSFEQICLHAEKNPEYMRNEILRLTKTRVEDGIMKTNSWFEAISIPKR